MKEMSVLQFRVRARPDKIEMPSTLLRAGSSLRLKNGYAQDDTMYKPPKLLHYGNVRPANHVASARDRVAAGVDLS
jgi:hypothetical protein